MAQYQAQHCSGPMWILNTSLPFLYFSPLSAIRKRSIGPLIIGAWIQDQFELREGMHEIVSECRRVFQRKFLG